MSSHPEVQKFKPTALRLSKAYVSPTLFTTKRQNILGRTADVQYLEFGTGDPTGVSLLSDMRRTMLY